jgi:hypothetical protein
MSAEFGPESTPRDRQDRTPRQSGHSRANAIQPSRVARPTNPTHGETSLAGSRGGTDDGASCARS